LLFFNSNDIYPVSADSTLPFAQHRDIFTYGADQEEHFIISDAPYEHQREMIFLKETNEHIAIWEGEKIEERAYEVTGIKRFTGCKISRKCYDDDALILYTSILMSITEPL
jgi:hypothetical protein